MSLRNCPTSLKEQLILPLFPNLPSYSFSAKLGFVIKVEGRPSEPYWMLLMRTWLNSIQQDLDKALAGGLIDADTGKVLATNVTDNV